jgi:Na+/alanine symporter
VSSCETLAWYSVLQVLQSQCKLRNELVVLTNIHGEKYAMTAHSTFRQPVKSSGLTAIAVGGLLAGILDLTQAFILFGWRVPLVVAGGLLGRQAIRGGLGTYVLGVFLHFFIALSVAAIYYLASRRLSFLKEYPLVCGLFYGAAVELVMNLVVLPLSALHARGPYKLHDLLQGLLAHMLLIGLPISFSIRRFAK